MYQIVHTYIYIYIYIYIYRDNRQCTYEYIVPSMKKQFDL